MSEERRKRKAERERQEQPRVGLLRTITIALVIIAAFAAVIYLGIRKRHSRYDDFAKCTAAKGAKMYGAFWCPHCEEQKEEFGASFQYVDYIECGVKGDTRAQTQVCKDANVKHYPTWEFANKTRVEGKQSFDFLGAETGCVQP
jgi:hypothetical protein